MVTHNSSGQIRSEAGFFPYALFFWFRVPSSPSRPPHAGTQISHGGLSWGSLCILLCHCDTVSDVFPMSTPRSFLLFLSQKGQHFDVFEATTKF